jgi:hypothetical protein
LVFCLFGPSQKIIEPLKAPQNRSFYCKVGEKNTTFRQGICKKSVMQLGTIWELHGTPWELDENTLGTMYNQKSPTFHLTQPKKKKKSP